MFFPFITTANDENDILNNVVHHLNTTPFLFIGSGLTRRYYNLPNWSDLLKHFSDLIHNNDEFAFANYKQLSNNNYPQLGSLIEKDFNKSWFNSRNIYNFSDDSLSSIKQGVSPFKCAIAEYINSLSDQSSKYSDEIALLKSVLQHNISGVITTNYDCFIENLVSDFKIYIGQDDLLFSSIQEIGEVYKIHGSITNPNSIVINENDYNEFNNKSKYLAAKLLTIFVEYPIIFIGYSISDPNIKQILNDIAACLNDEKIKTLSDRFIMVTRAKKDEPDIDISKMKIEVQSTYIQMINIKLSDYSLLYKALTTLKRSVPVKLLRLFKEEFYQYTVTNKPTKKMIVSLENNNINPEDLVFAISTPAKLSRYGLTGITSSDWYMNILDSSLDVPADDLLTIPYPKLVKSNNKLPVFKLLAEAKQEYPDIINQQNIQSLDDLLNNTIKKNRLRKHYEKDTITTLQEKFPFEKSLGEICYLPPSNIIVDQLESFLKETISKRPNIFESQSATDFRRLIRIYDWLKYFPKTQKSQ